MLSAADNDTLHLETPARDAKLRIEPAVSPSPVRLGGFRLFDSPKRRHFADDVATRRNEDATLGLICPPVNRWPGHFARSRRFRGSDTVHKCKRELSFRALATLFSRDNK
jgi:hypothetical protein